MYWLGGRRVGTVATLLSQCKYRVPLFLTVIVGITFVITGGGAKTAKSIAQNHTDRLQST